MSEPQPKTFGQLTLDDSIYVVEFEKTHYIIREIEIVKMRKARNNDVSKIDIMFGNGEHKEFDDYFQDNTIGILFNKNDAIFEIPNKAYYFTSKNTAEIFADIKNDHKENVENFKMSLRKTECSSPSMG